MALSRVKTWNAAETLTASDLNAEFNNICNHFGSLDNDDINSTATFTMGELIVGSGITSADGGQLHVHTASAGTIQAVADADEAVFENSAASGITILSGTSSTGMIAFGDSGDADIGKISYSHSSNGYTITANAATALQISSAGAVTTGGNVLSDTDSTDDLGSTSVRWANVYTDAIGDSGQALGVKATTLSFDAASTIDTSGNNALTLDAGSAVLTLDGGTLESDASTLSFDAAATIDTSGNNALTLDAGSAVLTLDGGTLESDATTFSFDAAATIDTSGNNNLTLSAGTGTIVATAGDVTIFDDNNNADTSLSIGTSATEALVVQALNGGSNKTLEELRFTTKTASATGDHGKMSFYIDEAEIATIDDGGIDLASGKSFTVAGSAVGGADVGTANTWTADQTFNDNVKVTLGTGGDADFYYDGTNTVLNTKVVGNGNLLVGQATSGGTDQAGYTGVQVGKTGLLLATTSATSNTETMLADNAYLSSGAWKHINTDEASYIYQNSGIIRFYTAASASADASFNGLERMQINATGAEIKVDGEVNAGLRFPTIGDHATNEYFCIGGATPSGYSASMRFMRGGTSLSAATETARFNTGGSFFLGDTENGNMTQGLTINQGANDNEIMAFKSSDVSHNMTSLAEADTYGVIQKQSGTAGGASLRGFADTADNPGVTVISYMTGINSTKSTSGNGAIGLQASLTNGSGGASTCASDDNLVCIHNHGTTRFIFDAEGSAHADVEWTTFDTHDDIAMLHDIEAMMVPDAFGKAMKYDQEYLMKIGILGKNSLHEEMPGRTRGMINTTKLSMLHHGAIRQVHQQLQDVKEFYEDKIAALEQRLLRLEA